MQVKESVTVPASGRHNKTCPFCEGKEPELLHLWTKHGMLKDEDELGRNLRAKGPISSDASKEYRGKKLKDFHGGGDDHKGWTAEEEAFEDIDIETEIPPTPHHLIPAKAAMAKSKSHEKWTTRSEERRVGKEGR